MKEVMSKIKKTNIKFKKNLDSRIKKLILKILQIEPKNRPTCDEILKSEELTQLTRDFDVFSFLFDEKEHPKVQGLT